MKIFPDSVRDRHTYVLGKTRSGKTTLLLTMLIQDIRQGKSVIFIDPKGGTAAKPGAAETLLSYIPESRINDTFYFHPYDSPLGLNPLVATDEREAELVVDDMLTIFKRLDSSWGVRMDAIFRYSFLTLLKIPGASILDLYDLLTDDGFREHALKQIQDTALLKFWRNEFAHFPKNAAEPITTRLSKFRTSTALTQIFSASSVELHQPGQIFIASFARCGEDLKGILGTLLVSLIQVAMTRRSEGAVYLYVDEFSMFAGTAFQRILREAGGFGLCLTLAHQNLSQLDDKTRGEIFGNVGTEIYFTIGPEDAPFIERHLQYHPPSARHWVGASGSRTLEIPQTGYSPARLPPYQAVVRCGTQTYPLSTWPLPTPKHDHSAEIKARMKTYAPSRAPVQPVQLDQDFVVPPSKPPDW